MEQAITAVGKDGFDGVYVANDGMASGAIAALKGANIDPADRPVTGQDAELAAIQRILTGEQLMTVYQPIRQIAETSAELAVDMVNGKTAEAAALAKSKVDNGHEQVPSVLLDTIVMTKDNIKDTVVAEGFLKAEQICSGPAAAACGDAGLSCPRAAGAATPPPVERGRSGPSRLVGPGPQGGDKPGSDQLGTGDRAANHHRPGAGVEGGAGLPRRGDASLCDHGHPDARRQRRHQLQVGTRPLPAVGGVAGEGGCGQVGAGRCGRGTLLKGGDVGHDQAAVGPAEPRDDLGDGRSVGARAAGRVDGDDLGAGLGDGACVVDRGRDVDPLGALLPQPDHRHVHGLAHGLDVGRAVGPDPHRPPEHGRPGHGGHERRAVERVPGRGLAGHHQAASQPPEDGVGLHAAHGGGPGRPRRASSAAPTTTASLPRRAGSMGTPVTAGSRCRRKCRSAAAQYRPAGTATPPPTTTDSGSTALTSPASSWPRTPPPSSTTSTAGPSPVSARRATSAKPTASPRAKALASLSNRTGRPSRAVSCWTRGTPAHPAMASVDATTVPAAGSTTPAVPTPQAATSARRAPSARPSPATTSSTARGPSRAGVGASRTSSTRWSASTSPTRVLVPPMSTPRQSPPVPVPTAALLAHGASSTAADSSPSTTAAVSNSSMNPHGHLRNETPDPPARAMAYPARMLLSSRPAHGGVGHSAGHSTRRYSARLKRTGWTTHPT